MSVIRYCRPREANACAPISILNAMKFQRRGATYRGDYKRIRRAVGFFGDYTSVSSFNRACRRYGFTRMYQPEWWKMARRVFLGDGLIVGLNFIRRRTVGPEIHFESDGHAFLISGVSSNAGEMRYRTVGLISAMRKFDNPWLTQEEILSPWYRGEKVHLSTVHVVPRRTM